MEKEMDPADQLLQTRALVVNRMSPHKNTLQRWEAFKKRRPMLARFWGPLRPYVKPLLVVINPLGVFARAWDAFILLAMFYTAVMTPYEIAFMSRDWPNIPQYGTNGTHVDWNPGGPDNIPSPYLIYTYESPRRLSAVVWILNRVCDAAFLSDILLQFNMAFFENTPRGAHLQWNRLVIARQYLRRSFLLDVTSSLPYDLLVGTDSNDDKSGLHALRVLKLLRLGRSLRIVTKIEQRMNVSLAYVRIVKYLFCLVFAFHFMACGLQATAEFEGASCNWISFSINTKWGGHACDVLIWQPTASYVYLEAFFWAALRNENQLVMQTKAEKTYCIISCIAIALIQASIIGEFFSIVDVLGFREKKFALAMDELNLFIATKMVPDDLAARLRTYYRLQNRQHVEALTSWTGVLLELPTSLRADVIAALGSNTKVVGVNYFKYLPSSHLTMLAMELRTNHFPRNERMVLKGTNLREGMVMVLQGGIIDVRCFLQNKGRLYLSTVHFPLIGEEIFWPGSKLASYTVISATNTTVLAIESQALLVLMDGIPGYDLVMREGRSAFMRHYISLFCQASERIADFCVAVKLVAISRGSRMPVLSLADVLYVAGYSIPGHVLQARTHFGQPFRYGEEGVTLSVSSDIAMFAAALNAPEVYKRALAAALFIQRWYQRVLYRGRVRILLRHFIMAGLEYSRKRLVNAERAFALSTTSTYTSKHWLAAFVETEEERAESRGERTSTGGAEAAERRMRGPAAAPRALTRGDLSAQRRESLLDDFVDSRMTLVEDDAPVGSLHVRPHKEPHAEHPLAVPKQRSIMIYAKGSGMRGASVMGGAGNSGTVHHANSPRRDPAPPASSRGKSDVKQ